jgi:AraC-like DNA-binding protein
MREGKTKELTLEAIGLLSGFSTRNTFYKAFLKSEGSPPGTFVDKESGNK